ncbi:MAG: hypothetical protein IPO21_05660 [Bacteroidales bacterium]|nr:hypothetical protein [Bacteroidales bacterium]
MRDKQTLVGLGFLPVILTVILAIASDSTIVYFMPTIVLGSTTIILLIAAKNSRSYRGFAAMGMATIAIFTGAASLLSLIVSLLIYAVK